MRPMAVARRLVTMLRPVTPAMTVAVLCRLANHGLGVAIPAVAAAGVVSAGRTIAELAALLAALALAKGVFRYLEQFTGHAVAFRLLARLRVDTYRSLLPLAPAGLEEDRSGDLVARAAGDVDRVEPFFAHTIAPLASGLLVPILAGLGLAVWVDPLLGSTFLVFPLLIVAVTPWIRARRVAALSTRARQLDGETAALLTESVQGSREIEVFGARRQVEARLDEGADQAGRVRRSLAGIASARSALGDALAGAAVVVVGAVAIMRLEAGVIDLAGLAAALAVAWTGTAPARAVEEVVPDLVQALSAAGRLFALADRPAPVAETGTSLPPPRAAVRFRQVTVHVGGHLALDRVDTRIEPGSMTAVVGPSGAGKTTLVELLVRFRDPDSGGVELGGVDLRALDAAALRETVALVPQRPDLFHGTLRQNLALARPDAGEDALWGALERVGLSEWVSGLPEGLDTGVGELGGMISGGQRQRLALARGLLRDAPILVLDEATSELDPAAEAVVLDTLAGMRGERTLVVVAHRIDTVVDADRILVLDRGRLVEAGVHADLVAAGGVYAGLWRRHQDVMA